MTAPRALVVGTAGHIDHGKSALVEALTGVHPDRLREERERGITIDLGFAHFTHGDAAVAIVDVPGHERFVRNMLAGAGGIDAVMLVVAADESVMPQTREHFDICRLLGIAHGLVVLTKRDLVDVTTLAIVEAEVREAVADSFLTRAPVIAVSARTGEGLEALREALAGLAGVAPRQARAGLVRLPVDRVFTVRGFGTVVTGTLVSGRVAEGDRLEALPERLEVRVRAVQIHGRAAADATAPRRVALNLAAAGAGELARGVTIGTPGSLPVVRRADVRVEVLPSAAPLLHGSRIRVHQGTSEVLARVAIAAVQAPDGPWTGAEPGRSGVAVPAGGQGYLRLRFERPMVVTRGDRLILRTYSPAITIAGGTVLDPEPPPGRLRRAAAFERFARLESDLGALQTWLHEAGPGGLATDDLVRRGGLARDGAETALSAGVSEGWAQRVGARVVESSVVTRVESDVQQALAGFHAIRPREDGLARETLRQQVVRDAPQEFFAAIISRLASGGLIAGTDRLRLSTHQPGLSQEWSAAADKLLRAVEAAGLMPPDESVLGDASGLGQAELRELIQALVRQDRLVRVDSLLFHPEALDRLKHDLRALGAGASVDVAFVKNRYGLSRKYAIPLLEWLDRERVTRRVGNGRVVLG